MPTTTLDTYFAEGVAKAASLGISGDLLIIGGLFVALFALSLRYGKNASISLIVGTFIALVLYTNFPYADRLQFFSGPRGAFYSFAAIFFASLAIGYMVMSRFLPPDFSARTPGRILDAGLLAAATTGLLVVLSYHVLPIDPLYRFAPSVDAFFAAPELLFWWLIASLAAIFVATRL